VTKLRGDNGEIWYVRNGEIKRIGNLSQGWATAMVDVQVGAREDLDRATAVIAATVQSMSKDGPWDEKLWEPVRVLGLESVGAEFVVIQTQAKTMPGESAAVARELRWRIKKAFDEAGIVITGGTPAAAAQEPGPTPAERVPAPVSETPAAAAPAPAPAPQPAPEPAGERAKAVPPPATGERSPAAGER
jgi:small conductance mechanosensitive channel